MQTDQPRDPAEIEREIERTQRDMSRTVDQLGAQLTPRSLVNALLDKAEENDFDARALLDGARRNPLALAMIGGGALWLISDADARPSALKPSSLGGSGSSDDAWHHEDSHHRGYIDHMSRVEPQIGEDDLTYRRRRDHARASYLMIEQRHDEDESSFRKRLDDATESMRQKRDALSERTRAAGRSAGAKGRGAMRSVTNSYRDNPLLGGLAAAFAGAVAGAAFPATETEEEYLGSMGEKAWAKGKDKARNLGESAREKKDELVDRADAKMANSGNGTTSGSRSGQNFGQESRGNA